MLNNFITSPSPCTSGTNSSYKSNTVWSKNLENYNWYWRNVQKEIVSSAMEEPDGTFMVRDASTKGDYTLTLRIKSTNKLIKIIVKNGKCGFTQDTLDFNSVPELISFYSKQSLKDFNEKLDTCLLHPLKTTLQIVMCRLEGVHAEYERVSRRYDQLFVQKASLFQDIQRKRGTLTAYMDALHIFQERNATLTTFHFFLLFNSLFSAVNKLTENKQKEIIRMNLELQESRIENIEKAKTLISTTLDNINRTIENIEDELEHLKPQLLNLHKYILFSYSKFLRLRDDCKELLLTNNTPNTQIENTLQAVSYILDFEPLSLTNFLLKVQITWDPEDWLISDGNKENAVKLINAAVLNRNSESKDGIFLIRPSQSQSGFYALTITKDTTVHSCLIEYREPRKSDYCGYAFLNTNMFFSTLVDFVRYYSKISLIEHNAHLNTCLTFPALLLLK